MLPALLIKLLLNSKYCIRKFVPPFPPAPSLQAQNGQSATTTDEGTGLAGRKPWGRARGESDMDDKQRDYKKIWGEGNRARENGKGIEQERTKSTERI